MIVVALVFALASATVDAMWHAPVPSYGTPPGVGYWESR